MADVAAQAPRLPAGEASLIGFSFRIPGIFPILALGLAVRLALATIHGFGVDMGTFQAWSNDLARENPWGFYREGFFTDYAPGYMYVLWFIGEVNERVHFEPNQYEFILKLPSIVADLASATLLYIMLKDTRPRMALVAAAIYTFFPAALFIGALWGQVDSLLAFFLLLTIYYISKGKPMYAGIAFVVAFLVKPQAIAAFPFFAFWILRDFVWEPYKAGDHKTATNTLLMCTAVPLLVFLAIITPFFKLEPWRLYDVLSDAANTANYRVNSFWAYNFWNTGGIFELGFKCDNAADCQGDNAKNATEFLGIATRWWGVILFAAATSGVMFSLRKAKGTGFLALGTALSVLAFYLFLTRMHERYLFPAFLPFLLACALLQSRALWAAFFVTSTIHFLNLYHVFAYYQLYGEEMARYGDWLRVDFLHRWVESGDVVSILPRVQPGDFDPPLIGHLETVQVLSAILVISWLALVVYAAYLSKRREPGPA